MVDLKIAKGSIRGPFYCILIFIFITAAIAVIQQVGWSFGSFLIPALWGLAAILPLRAGEGNLLTFGLMAPRLRINIRYFLLSSLVVFPLFAAGFRLYVRWGFFLPVTIPFEGVSIPNWLAYNFLAVALFEELFFRGFVQGRFERFAVARIEGQAVRFWTPILVSSLLFAVAHVAVYLDPLRLAVFFPGLLFGWLRAKSDSLLAPILSHGTANLVSMLLIGSVP
jgi:membrane protease YdiL (CAAX protease family)